jgi:hypothetical protein
VKHEAGCGWELMLELGQLLNSKLTKAMTQLQLASICIHSVINGQCPMSQFVSYTLLAGLLGQGFYLHKEQHKHRINAHIDPCPKWDSNP